MTLKNKKIRRACPTLTQCIRAVGPTKDWEGNCYGVADAIVKAGLIDGGVAVYGHWLGPIHPQSLFAHKSSLGFCQHGWVSMPDGSVIDPTRWVFEHVTPYIFHGEEEGLYDEGGNSHRMMLMQPPPVVKKGDRMVDVGSMSRLEMEFLCGLLDAKYEQSKNKILSKSQLMWLANISPKVLGTFRDSVYEMIEKTGHVAYVPIDNWRAFDRQRQKKQKKYGGAKNGKE